MQITFFFLGKNVLYTIEKIDLKVYNIVWYFIMKSTYKLIERNLKICFLDAKTVNIERRIV